MKREPKLKWIERSQVPDHQWRDWSWQWAYRLTEAAQIGAVFDLDAEQIAQIEETARRFRVAITPYYADLIHRTGRPAALWKQVIPDPAELDDDPRLSLDPLSEQRDSLVKGLVHRYTDRVLLLLTDRCAVYCRHCNRRRLASGSEHDRTPIEVELWLRYLRDHKQVREVILSGGDPLSWSDERLNKLLTKLRQIAHLEIIRFGTRLPVVLPFRITDDFCKMLKRHQPVYLNIHINHPLELTIELHEACWKLADSGIPLGSQTVLLKGVNDDGAILQELFRGLLKMRVKPYCLYHPDPVQGTAHLRTSIQKGLDIMDFLIANTSGLALPHYVVDAPDGKGKIPLQNPRHTQGSEGVTVLKPFSGGAAPYDDGEA
ncbi:MAG: KamA family radical SAM protein [bacterium]|nr:KamA family radical SAM protein [bacterium]